MTEKIEKQKIVVWGDSIAASGWPELMEFGYNAICNTGTPITVVNSGQCGKPAAQAQKDFFNSVMAHIPNIVIIQFGLNDLRFDGSRKKKPISTPEEFEMHIGKMIRLCRDESHAQVIVFGNHRTFTPHLILPSGFLYDKTVRIYNRAAAAASMAAGVRFVDMEKIALNSKIPFTQILDDDGVHLNNFGKNIYWRVGVTEILRMQSGLLEIDEKQTIKNELI